MAHIEPADLAEAEYEDLHPTTLRTVAGQQGALDEPVAWLRDAHKGMEDECLVPAAAGDPGAFPVYASPQPALAVKGLKWSDYSDEDGRHFEAHTIIGVYTVRGDHLEFNGHFVKTCSSPEAAKAAAQADYETRIRSALVSPPPSGEVEDGTEELHIDSLRLLAFKTNSDEDRAAYFNAASKWFQDRHYRALATAPATADGWRTKAVDDVLAERKRQVEAEGWTPEHDDLHDEGELARAAGLYALIAGADATDYRNARDGYGMTDYLAAVLKAYWPFNRSWFKPTNRRRDLVKAGGLIIGEIERLDRLPAAPTATGGR